MGQKNILIIGSTDPAALELIFSNELNHLGIQNHVMGVQNVFLFYYRGSLMNKIIYRLGLSRVILQIQNKIKDEVVKRNPDTILVFKGMEITPNTLEWIKLKGIKIINYNPDHPFIFSGRGSGNKNVSDSIRQFDYYCSYADDVVNKLKNLGVQSVKIPFGFDEKGFVYKELEPSEEIRKTCFLGNADKFRVKFLNDLAKMGLKIDVFGENWGQFSLNPSINVGSAKYGNEFWITLQKYAVQLNLLRPHNLHSHNMRSFDIPGAGGVMLAPFTEDHANFYKDCQDVFLFNNTEQAFDIAKQLTNLTFEERSEIRRQARKKSVEQHTYAARVNQLLNCIEG